MFVVPSSAGGGAMVSGAGGRYPRSEASSPPVQSESASGLQEHWIPLFAVSVLLPSNLRSLVVGSMGHTLRITKTCQSNGVYVP